MSEIKKNELTAQDYSDLLNGRNRGKNYSSSYFYVKRKNKENPTKKEILLNNGVGLPPNLNLETYTGDNKKKRKKIDPNVVRFLQNR